MSGRNESMDNDAKEMLSGWMFASSPVCLWTECRCALSLAVLTSKPDSESCELLSDICTNHAT